MTTEPTTAENGERAAKARKVLSAYHINVEADAAVSDLLADLMHLCDVEEWSFTDLLERATRHHREEVLGEE